MGGWGLLIAFLLGMLGGRGASDNLFTGVGAGIEGGGGGAE